MNIINKVIFPKFSGIKCHMMPFIQGDPDSLPKEYKSYSSIVKNNFLDKGKIGYITIDESFVSAGKTQRGYNSSGINRNVHIEVGMGKKEFHWGSSWGGNYKVLLDKETQVLIANSISNTCKVFDTTERRFTSDGDLSDYIEDYPESSGILLKSGQLAKMSIFTPHECIKQTKSGNRQFIRIVGEGVEGREDYFTLNPLI